MASSTSKLLTQAQFQALITGIPIYCPNATFSVAGRTFTAPQAVAFIASVLNASVAVTATRAAWLAALKAEEATIAGDGQVARELREDVALMFSNAPTTLSAFAIEPRKKPKPLTAAARAAATAKAEATRKARGTTSKKKKALISGNVLGVNITPFTSSGEAPTATPTATSPVTPATGGAAGVVTPTHS